MAVGHAIALPAMPATDAYPGRWLDVMVSICGVSLVVLMQGADEAGAEAFIERVRAILAVPRPDLPTVRVSAGLRAAAATPR